MRRVLFEWRGIRIWSYPAMLYLGLVAGVIAQYKMAPARGLPAARAYWATMILLPVALAGSRILYVAAHWRDYRDDLSRIWRHGEGGLAMYGGVPLMLVASLPVLSWLGLPFWRFWDSAVFCIFTGMAFARVGCLLNGCCSGRETTGRLALWLPDDRGRWARRVPVQLYEFIAAVVLLSVCVVAAPWLSEPGMLFLVAVASYGVIRFVLEGARDSRGPVGRFDLQRAISILLVIVATAGWLLMY